MMQGALLEAHPTDRGWQTAPTASPGHGTALPGMPGCRWTSPTQRCSPGGCPAKCRPVAPANPKFPVWGSAPRLHAPQADPHTRAERRSSESVPTAKASSSLNPYQMNDASSNKTQYHNINNIYFQAKLQPGLLIPVIKANGSSVIIAASLEPTVRVLKPCIIFFFIAAC